jgi:uncharacterized protein (DUF608 family)
LLRASTTMDVDYQGSFPVLALFPDLKLSQMKRILLHQNTIGQVPHNYPGNVDQADDGFARVDMNPQFVMMVCRDYLWTGDKEYLNAMWPHVIKAMAFTESLDTNADALPDRDTGLQTYDQWRMRGTPAYIASLWIGGLRAAICMANDMRMKDARRALVGTAEAGIGQLRPNALQRRVLTACGLTAKPARRSLHDGPGFWRMVYRPHRPANHAFQRETQSHQSTAF